MDVEAAPNFRRAWRGYHPEDVDRFLKETAEERQRLREALERVEALIAHCQEGPAQIIASAQREADDIRAAAKLQARQFLEEVKRRIVEPTPRSALFEPPPTQVVAEVPIFTETTAIAQTPSMAEAPVSYAPPPRPAMRGSGPIRIQEWDLRSLHPEPPKHNKRMMQAAAIGAACLLVILVQTLDFRGARALLGIKTQSLGAAPAAASGVVQPIDGDAARADNTLTLTLTALRECWVRTVIDGGHEMERMLKAQETLVLHAHDEALLKVGDAGAVSLLINNRPARALGASGQVITQLITRSNYAGLLSE